MALTTIWMLWSSMPVMVSPRMTGACPAMLAAMRSIFCSPCELGICPAESEAARAQISGSSASVIV